jgi:threonine/homoserine/homoserine lactone efflux protein
MPLQLLLPLSLFAFVTSITPGPNNIMLLTSGVNFGFRATIPHIFGIGTGFFSVLFAIGIGLGEVFKAYPEYYTVMKWISAVYFFYLAWGITRSATPQADAGSRKNARPMSYLGAAAFQWANPKAIVMAIACFSSYAPLNSSVRDVIAIASLVMAINLPCVSVWALFGSRLRDYLQNPSHRMTFNWIMAILLISSLLPIFL